VAFDSLKMVLNAKQYEMEKNGVEKANANQYYGVWSISGFMGILKYWVSGSVCFHLELPTTILNRMYY